MRPRHHVNARTGCRLNTGCIVRTYDPMTDYAGSATGVYVGTGKQWPSLIEPRAVTTPEPSTTTVPPSWTTQSRVSISTTDSSRPMTGSERRRSLSNDPAAQSIAERYAAPMLEAAIAGPRDWRPVAAPGGCRSRPKSGGTSSRLPPATPGFRPRRVHGLQDFHDRRVVVAYRNDGEDRRCRWDILAGIDHPLKPTNECVVY